MTVIVGNCAAFKIHIQEEAQYQHRHYEKYVTLRILNYQRHFVLQALQSGNV